MLRITYRRLSVAFELEYGVVAQHTVDVVRPSNLQLDEALAKVRLIGSEYKATGLSRGVGLSL